MLAHSKCIEQLDLAHRTTMSSKSFIGSPKCSLLPSSSDKGQPGDPATTSELSTTRTNRLLLCLHIDARSAFLRYRCCGLIPQRLRPHLGSRAKHIAEHLHESAGLQVSDLQSRLLNGISCYQ